MRVENLHRLILLLSLAGASCGSTRQSHKPETGPESAVVDEQQRERAGIERKLALASMRLQKARLERAHGEARSKATVDNARRALELAESKLRVFEERDAPTRVQRARLDVARSENRLADERAELAQLEMMYADAQLSTKTEEIVIDRQKRSMQLAERALELDHADLATLESATIPNERQGLSLDLAEKRSALERAEQEAESAAAAGDLEIAGVEAELADLSDQLAAKQGAEKESRP